MEKEKRALRRSRLYYLLAFTLVLLVDLLIVFFAHPPKMATLLLQGLTVFVQILIAVFAIWGNQIRALFSGPKLELSLDRPEGQITKIIIQENKCPAVLGAIKPETKVLPARYFHLRVHNKTRGVPAIKTQVILYSIVRPHKEGNPEALDINGRLPFPWKFRGGDFDPHIRFKDAVMYSVIGPDDYCDLAVLTPGHFQLRAEHWMLVDEYLEIKSGEKTTVEAIAIAENAQSNLLKLDISWDGVWPEKHEQVTDHIKIEPCRPLKKRKNKADC